MFNPPKESYGGLRFVCLYFLRVSQGVVQVQALRAFFFALLFSLRFCGFARPNINSLKENISNSYNRVKPIVSSFSAFGS